MLVWLVFDSSHDRGLGHISRLIAFGQLLESKGIDYCFHGDSSIPKLAIDFIQKNNLVAGCTCSGNPNLIVIDTYNKRTIEKFNKLGIARVLVFADEVTPTLGANAVVEVSPISMSKEYPSGSPVLEFRNSPLLRDEVVAYDGAAENLNAKMNNWLVTLGGVDDLVYRNFLVALQSTLQHQELNVTVASDSYSVGKIANTLGFEWIDHALDVSDICDAFEGAITGAGVTAWELAYLRKPGFVIGVAANQDFQLDYLVGHGIRPGVGLADQELLPKLRMLFEPFHSNSEVVRPIDGRERVYEFMFSLL